MFVMMMQHPHEHHRGWHHGGGGGFTVGGIAGCCRRTSADLKGAPCSISTKPNMSQFMVQSATVHSSVMSQISTEAFGSIRTVASLTKEEKFAQLYEAANRTPFK